MATKDHSLDSKIIESAKQEFLKYGFQKASVHAIARNAQLTTGALYTRYTSKDELFYSLIKDTLNIIYENNNKINKLYLDVKNDFSMDKLFDVVKIEEKSYIDILFDHYDDCMLFVCKSEGSSSRKIFDDFLNMKIQGTIEYLKYISHFDLDYDGIELLISQQFMFYRQILEKGYNKEKAISCLETAKIFIEAGWKSIFSYVK